MSDEEDFVRRVLHDGEPPPLSTAERWFEMLEDEWDQYAAKVASGPQSGVWARGGWTREKLQGDSRLQDYENAQRADDKLAAIWSALENLRPLWSLRWHEPLFISAMDKLVETFFLPGGNDWRYTLERTCHWGFTDFDLTVFEWGNDDDIFFRDWIPYSAFIARQTWYTPSHCLDYQYKQGELGARKYIAIYQAIAAIRRAMLTGVEDSPELEAPLQAALAMPAGNFDERGQIIWYPDLTPDKQAEWDAIQAEWDAAHNQKS